MGSCQLSCTFLDYLAGFCYMFGLSCWLLLKESSFHMLVYIHIYVKTVLKVPWKWVEVDVDVVGR